MIIQLNTDNNVHFGEKSREEYTSFISQELDRYSEHITRVEVYLGDENGRKEGQNDKRCLMEARYEGMAPIVATSHANTYELAIEAALSTLKSNLAKVRERLSSH
ncbi:MAG TPA: HPF/RaiA family ribosome-associated protein [Flavipsychrobacter sp.]|nr:HPF/RaiA family ribosome-associated protein [Flavipsychrobacter sp.]